MSKKNKKNSKINQKIRHYFDDDPFDVGIERLSSTTLSDLFNTIGIYDIEHNKKLLLKTIRMIWSEAETSMKEEILNFFINEGKIYKRQKESLPGYERDEKIELLLLQLDASEEEKQLLYDAFIETRSKKITLEKMESKLRYIRYEAKREALQKELEGLFDIDDSFEFNASIEYKLFGESFHKIHTLSTPPYPYEFIESHEMDFLLQKIELDKRDAVLAKQAALNLFIAQLKEPHPYLSHRQIRDALRTSAPKSRLRFALIDQATLFSIVKQKLDAEALELHAQELLVVLNAKVKLPHSPKELSYKLDLHIDLDGLLESIWGGEDLEFSTLISEAKEEHESHFLSQLQALLEECASHATLLHFTQETLAQKVYALLEDLLGQTLHITAKMSKKVSRRFIYSIHEQLIKKQREALLARTIRDFKNLFPLARDMRRKLTLHIGPTNSGKTYQAMQKLQKADTGYYLAPLRLLALEGYEELKALGIESSLITGEEQIIDANATHISSTIEMLNFEVDVDVCVIDEVQMIDDRDRGWAWANAIIGAPAKEIIMTGSINAKEAIIALAEYLGEELEIIEFERKNPLTLLPHATNHKHVEAGSAIIAFSRREVLKLKQEFTKDFSISVVYGNLSPEVRREEARRFREGETQLLIATDAIAMGMNLPIKTILFSKAEKFDGVSERSLYPSEVHQIAGRAGRYGLHEVGYVGALNEQTLKVITRNFTKEAKTITIPFKVMANLEHIKLVGKILEESSLEIILKFFVDNMVFNGPFYAASLEDMLEAAKIVDAYNLDIATKYHLACAPLTLKSPYIVAAFESYLRSLERCEPIYYVPPRLYGSFAPTSEELLQAEDMVKEISLYLWLSYRFGDYFVDVQKAKESRGRINKYIEESLQQTQLANRCKLCGVALPVGSKYAICQSCFKKNYTNFRPSRKRH